MKKVRFTSVNYFQDMLNGKMRKDINVVEKKGKVHNLQIGDICFSYPFYLSWNCIHPWI